MRAQGRLELLREALADDAGEVAFRDMAEVGGNPARILALWQELLTEHAAVGRTLRGVGESAFVGRRESELLECHLVNQLCDLVLLRSAATGTTVRVTTWL